MALSLEYPFRTKQSRIMKRSILLTVAGLMLLGIESNAQRLVTSFGVELQWGMPSEVYYTLEQDYWGYDLVHTTRFVDRRATFFNVVLQRGNMFVTLTLDPFGRVHQRVVAYNYPFSNHICNDFCGYHNAYYTRNVVYCNAHSHYGHNHVAYNPVYVAPAPGHAHHDHYNYNYAQHNEKQNHNHDGYSDNNNHNNNSQQNAGRSNSRSSGSSNSRENSASQNNSRSDSNRDATATRTSSASSRSQYPTRRSN